MKIFKLAIYSILFTFTFSLCDNKSNNHSKPKKIPKNAIWKGGVDGGCWFILNKVTQNNLFATIYHENGEIWQKGSFMKIGKCKADSVEILSNITSFDGINILTYEKCHYKYHSPTKSSSR